MRQGFRRRGGAFTLIELLVVISIIALLVGILLPALGHARRTAQSVKSQANLHSLGQVQAIYTGEFRDSLINAFHIKGYRRAGGVGGATGWATVRKPNTPPGWRWEFAARRTPPKWYSEMYAFHWYSIIGDWINPGDYASEIQFAPLDVVLENRLVDVWYNDPDFSPDRGIWDTSYVLSPTSWFQSSRYADDQRPNALRFNPVDSLAKRNRMSDVAYPSQKVMMWERFDWTKKSRRATIFNPFQNIGGIPTDFGEEKLSPQWNNPEAEPAVVTADGSVSRIKIADLNERTQSDNEVTKRAATPTDMWNPPITMLKHYSMDQDGFEIGNQESGYGQYPAYFWATRDGIRGRDFQR